MPNTTTTLDILRDDRLLQSRTFDGPVIKIGRLRTSHVRLDDDAVARMHAVIEVSESQLRLVDLGSVAGTMLNGAWVARHAPVDDGDRLRIGPYEIVVRTEPVPTRARATGQPVPVATKTLARALGPHVAAAAPPSSTLRGSIDPGEVEDLGGNRVTEVIAAYRGSVLDVQHVGQTRDRRGRAPVWMGVGGAMMAAGLALFGYEATRDWEAHRREVATAAEAGRSAPAEPGLGLGGLGLGLALFGLVPLVQGLSQRRDVGCTDYTVGEDHGASFHLDRRSLGADVSIPLVCSGARPMLAFTSSMRGELETEGQRFSLSDLIASGHAQSRGSWHAIALPRDARGRIQAGEVTFHVAAVAPGRANAGRTEVDRSFWLCNGASLATLGSLLVLMHLVPDEIMDLQLPENVAENRFVGFMNQPDQELDDPEPDPDVVSEKPSRAGGRGERHAGNEGRMGDPRKKSHQGLYAMKNRGTPPTLARSFDPELDARSAGILGMVQLDQSHFFADAAGAAFASGVDDTDVWGSLHGAEIGAAYGTGGLGLVGSGRGGGGDAHGTIGLGHVGTIGKGGGGGDGAGYGRGDDYANVGHGGRRRKQPVVRAAKGKVDGALDKDIIRRVVRAHINEVRHCYNAALTRDPNARGRVSVQFTIGPTGTVAAAVPTQNTLGDLRAARCVARAVQRWRFPKPPGGGRAMVSYPFVFNPG